MSQEHERKLTQVLNEPKARLFQSSAAKPGHPGYSDRTGQLVEVVRALTEDEVGDEETTMYLIRFSDGTTTHAFGFELLEAPK